MIDYSYDGNHSLVVTLSLLEYTEDYDYDGDHSLAMKVSTYPNLPFMSINSDNGHDGDHDRDDAPSLPMISFVNSSELDK